MIFDLSQILSPCRSLWCGDVGGGRTGASVHTHGWDFCFIYLSLHLRLTVPIIETRKFDCSAKHEITRPVNRLFQVYSQRVSVVTGMNIFNIWSRKPYRIHESRHPCGYTTCKTRNHYIHWFYGFTKLLVINVLVDKIFGLHISE